MPIEFSISLLSRSQALRVTLVLTEALLLCTSCAEVDAGGDFAAASRTIAERTGSPETFDPSRSRREIRAAVLAVLADDLSVEEAVRVALLNNPGLQAAYADLGISRADLVEAGLLANPSLFASARFPDGSHGRTNLSFSLSEDLLGLLWMPSRKRLARTRLEQARCELVRRAVTLAGEVRATCYRLLSLARVEASFAEDLGLAERSVKLAGDRLAAGQGDAVEVDLAREDLLALKRDQLQAERDRELAHADLARLLGLTRWREEWELRDTLERRQPLPALAELVELALERRLDLAAAALRVRAAAIELERQGGQPLATLEAGVEGERAEGPPSLLGPAATLELPIFHQHQPAIARASFALVQARRRYEEGLDQAQREVTAAAIEVRHDLELVRLYEEEILPQASRAVAAAERAYRSGVRGILALMQAQRFLIEQRRAHAATLGDYAAARARLETALGGRLPAPEGNR